MLRRALRSRIGVAGAGLTGLGLLGVVALNLRGASAQREMSSLPDDLAKYLSTPAPGAPLPKHTDLLGAVSGFPPQSSFPAAFFQRQDENDDAAFYSQPRFVPHIDDGAIRSLTAYGGGAD